MKRVALLLMGLAMVIVAPQKLKAQDILTEVYGYARSRRVIHAGFVASLLMAVVLVFILETRQKSFFLE